MPALATLPLVEIVWWLGVFIFCWLCLKIAQAILGVTGSAVGWIPFVGGFVAHKIEDVAHKIAGVMGAAMGFADQRVAAAIHDLARLTDWIGREIASHANLLLTIAEALTGTLPASYLLKELHNLERIGKAAQSTAIGIGHDIPQRVEGAARGIEAGVNQRITSLDRELNRALDRTIPGLAGEIHGLERGATRTWDWILRHPRTVASTAFAGAVAWALARIGVSWIRCNNWKRIGREVCGTDGQLITDALGLLAAGAVIADFRELVKIAQGVEKVAAEGVQELLRV